MTNKRKKLLFVGALLIFIVIWLVIGGKKNNICHRLSDEEIYERLKIWFNPEDEEIEMFHELNGQWSGWKLVQGCNGIVNIEPETIDLSKIGNYEITYIVTAINSVDKKVTKEYKKIIKVVEAHPQIFMKEKNIVLHLNDYFEADKWYTVTNIADWQLIVECNVDTSKMGKYYLTVKTVNPRTGETIQDEMTIDVIDESLENKEGCHLVWIVDREEIAEKGHYATINVEQQGHWQWVLVSDEVGHYETIHHEEKSHTEWDSEKFYWYSYYDEANEVRVVIASYEVEEMGMNPSEYGATLGDWVKGFLIRPDWRYTNEHKVIDREAYDEEIWVVDKPAVWEEQWIIDCEAYSYQVWVIDQPKQQEIGHWENICD